jgi:ribosome-associated heat shock protein Hsp15
LRIDKYLWFARITKTRAYAQQVAEAGHIRINGRRVDRAHAIVKPGETITLMIHDRLRILRIEALPTRRGPPSEASACYIDLPVDGTAAQS